MTLHDTWDGHATPDLSAFGSKVFVTGGSGFIGSHVVRRLLELGKDVTVLVLPGDPAPLLDGLPVRRVEGDLAEEGTLAVAMQGCDLVFHLAAIYALWLPRPALMYEVNVGGTRRMLAAAAKAGVKRLVHTSSIAAVGYLAGRGVADETTRFDEWDVADDYVLSKYISELEALRPDHLAALDVVAVNPAFPFGPGDIAPTPTGRMVDTALKGLMPVYVDGGLNAVDVRDVAEGHLLAAERGRPGERYILGAHNLTFEEIGHLIARVADRKPPRFRAPTGMMTRLAGVTELVSERITRRPPMMTPQSVAYMAGRYLWFSVDKARAELGYAPRPAEQAMRAAVQWFRSR